jgi:hypothetical protein
MSTGRERDIVLQYTLYAGHIFQAVYRDDDLAGQRIFSNYTNAGPSTSS